MGNRKCYFLMSPEGSGNYMMAEALVEAGCHYVNEEKNLRDHLMGCSADKIVIIRSLPHRGEFLDMLRICDDIWWNIYDIVPVVMVREPNATVRSVMRRMPEKTELEVKYQMKVAWQKIGMLAHNLAIRPIPYEAVIHSREFREWLFMEWDLPYPGGYAFTDQNRKYYE